MSEIEQLEGRLQAALDRIRMAAAAQPAPMTGDDAAAQEIARLGQALEEERTANAQLEERVRAIRARQDEKIGALERQVEDKGREISALRAELEAAEGSDAQEELDALKRARQEDLRQTEALVETLEGLVRSGGARDA
ncbi:MAG: hypothetical protein ACU0CI_07345 [Shimia sp.]